MSKSESRSLESTTWEPTVPQYVVLKFWIAVFAEEEIDVKFPQNFFPHFHSILMRNCQVSLEESASTHIFAKLYLQYAYNSQHCPEEMNISGSKTPTTFISFHTNYTHGACY